jgi:hypothetical protein
MKRPTNKVVDLTLRRGCTMPAFMSKSPEANIYTSLEKFVE